MVPVRWEGKQTFRSGGILQHCSVLHGPASCGRCSLSLSAAWGSWNYQTPSFKLETSTPPSLLLLAELHCKLNLQASQLFQTLWSTEVETCKESGWLTLHSPSIHSLYPCSLLPAEGGGDDSGGLAVWTRLLWHISDTEEEDPQTYGVMPPGLKDEGLCCVMWLTLGGVGGFSSKRWPPGSRTCPERAHMMRIRVFSRNSLPLSDPFLVLLLLISFPVSPNTKTFTLHFLSGFVCVATRLQRSYMVQIRPLGVHLLLTLLYILAQPPPPPHTALRICFIFCTGYDSPTFDLLII